MRYSMILCVVLMGITLSIFWQTGGHQFINFDDPLYVTNNPHVKGGITGKNILWAFTTTTASNWHPLTWLSHMADVEIFGLNPRGHHLTSVFIHTASTFLLFLLLTQITAAPWQSLFVTALFALHPLHVESVAWVAERKDVLSGFFWFLTLLFYAGYVKHRTIKFYLLTLFSLIAGLMTKPMLVTLPVIMLLLDYWPLGRVSLQRAENQRGMEINFWWLVKEKTPFLLCSGLSAMITLYAQGKGGTMSPLDVVPLANRMANALVAYAKYIAKTVWPQNLAFLYPLPVSPPLWQIFASCALLILISMGAIHLRRRKPYLIVGWVWFLITLIPVIGLVQVGGQSMADRYTYIPLLGLFMMASWGLPDLLRGLRYRLAMLVTLSGIIIIVLSATTWRQLRYWENNISLYRHTLNVTADNYIVLTNLGVALAERGEVSAAIQSYREALRICPRSANAHTNLGAALMSQGKFQEAMSHYDEVLRLRPDYPLARINLGKALNNMGVAEAEKGNLRAAVGYFMEALRIDPDSVDGHFNLGITLARLNRVAEATDQFMHVLRLTPESSAARTWLRRLGRSTKEAQTQGEK